MESRNEKGTKGQTPRSTKLFDREGKHKQQGLGKKHPWRDVINSVIDPIEATDNFRYKGPQATTAQHDKILQNPSVQNSTPLRPYKMHAGYETKVCEDDAHKTTS
jgi:hypothetical protein